MKTKRIIGLSSLALSMCVLPACSLTKKGPKDVLSIPGVIEYYTREEKEQSGIVKKLDKKLEGKCREVSEERYAIMENDDSTFTFYGLRNGIYKLVTLESYSYVDIYSDYFAIAYYKDDTYYYDAYTFDGVCLIKETEDYDYYTETLSSFFYQKDDTEAYISITLITVARYDSDGNYFENNFYKVNMQYRDGRNSTKIYTPEDYFALDFNRVNNITEINAMDGAPYGASGYKLLENGETLEIYKDNKMVDTIAFNSFCTISNGSIFYQEMVETDSKNYDLYLDCKYYTIHSYTYDINSQKEKEIPFDGYVYTYGYYGSIMKLDKNNNSVVACNSVSAYKVMNKKMSDDVILNMYLDGKGNAYTGLAFNDIQKIGENEYFMAGNVDYIYNSKTKEKTLLDSNYPRYYSIKLYNDYYYLINQKGELVTNDAFIDYYICSEYIDSIEFFGMKFDGKEYLCTLKDGVYKEYSIDELAKKYVDNDWFIDDSRSLLCVEEANAIKLVSILTGEEVITIETDGYYIYDELYGNYDYFYFSNDHLIIYEVSYE